MRVEMLLVEIEVAFILRDCTPEGFDAGGLQTKSPPTVCSQISQSQLNSQAEQVGQGIFRDNIGDSRPANCQWRLCWPKLS